MKKLGYCALGMCLLASIISCKRNELDFDKLSDRVAVERQLAAPLVHGELTITDMAEDNADSLIVIDGDTVKLVYNKDSAFYVSVLELLDIPEQTMMDYVISPDSDIDVSLIPTGTRVQLDSLISDTIFTLNVGNSMRIDSIFVNRGNFVISVENNFEHDMRLVVSSSSIFDPSNRAFKDSTDLIPPSGSLQTSFPMDDHIIRTYKDAEHQSAIIVRFTPVIVKSASSNVINASDAININFGLDQIEDFNALFGFFGFQNETIDTVLEGFTPDMFGKIEGEFNVTDPRIRLHYQNRTGVATRVDLSLYLSYPDKPVDTIDLGVKDLLYSDDYLNPLMLGTFNYDKSNVDNIDQLISFPMAEQTSAFADVTTNPGADSLTTKNWAVKESDVQIDLEVEVPMEFRADLTYQDTMQIREDAPDQDVEYEIEYANLHYTMENYFPVAIGGDLILYDSINNVSLDTISLSKTGEFLVAAAPVDGEGNVLNGQVEPHKSFIEIDAATAENMLNVATHLIFRATLQSTDFNNNTNVRIGVSNKLLFQFGVDAKGKYTSN